jgi:hypothetical protein
MVQINDNYYVSKVLPVFSRRVYILFLWMTSLQWK